MRNHFCYSSKNEEYEESNISFPGDWGCRISQNPWGYGSSSSLGTLLIVTKQTNNMGHMCNISNKDGWLFVTHSLTYSKKWNIIFHFFRGWLLFIKISFEVSYNINTLKIWHGFSNRFQQIFLCWVNFIFWRQQVNFKFQYIFRTLMEFIIFKGQEISEKNSGVLNSSKKPTIFPNSCHKGLNWVKERYFTK